MFLSPSHVLPLSPFMTRLPAPPDFLSRWVLDCVYCNPTRGRLRNRGVHLPKVPAIARARTCTTALRAHPTLLQCNAKRKETKKETKQTTHRARAHTHTHTYCQHTYAQTSTAAALYSMTSLVDNKLREEGLPHRDQVSSPP